MTIKVYLIRKSLLQIKKRVWLKKSAFGWSKGFLEETKWTIESKNYELRFDMVDDPTSILYCSLIIVHNPNTKQAQINIH